MPDATLTELTADIVSSYVTQNQVSIDLIPEIIRTTYSTLADIASGKSEVPAESAKLTPAISVKRSITPDFLISLEDGKKYKSLKRHLRTKYDMSPEQYRTKWGLPRDYPMVAPNYAASRSALAKSIGLGRGGIQNPAKASRTRKPAASA